MKAENRKRKRKIAPDWFGCGRAITQESWDRFLVARRDYYAKLDAERPVAGGPLDNIA